MKWSTVLRSGERWIHQVNTPRSASRLWRRKTAAELNRDTSRRLRAAWNPVKPAAQAVCGTLLILVGLVLFGRRKFGRTPILVGDAVVMFLPMATAGFLVLYVLRVCNYTGATAGGSPSWLCSSCQEVQDRGGRCACGGVLENLNLFTPNTCPRCGYDLRGGGNRCAECGCVPPPSGPTVIPPQPAGAARATDRDSHDRGSHDRDSQQKRATRS